MCKYCIFTMDWTSRICPHWTILIILLLLLLLPPILFSESETTLGVGELIKKVSYCKQIISAFMVDHVKICLTSGLISMR